MKQKKVPLRKCTGCQNMKSKEELVRVVKSETGEFYLDTTLKKPGRGAYICKNIQCLEKAQKSKGLERSFKTFIKKDIYETLKENITSLEQGSANG